MGRLQGKVALVTGAGKPRGIGGVTGREMAREGARVVIADLPASDVAQTAEEFRAEGLDVSHAFVNLVDEDSIRAMVQGVVSSHGTIDILFNNVALTGSSPGFEREGHSDSDILNMDAEVWRKTFDINVVGLALTIKHVVPLMIAQGSGAIINTSSTAARRFQSHLSAYQASKAAVDAITGVVASSYGKQGIRCNAVAPGTTLTSNVAEVMTEERQAISRDYSLTPDLAVPEDQAAAVIFLASDEARRITGHTLLVDGGITVQMPYVPQVRKLSNAGMT